MSSLNKSKTIQVRYIVKSNLKIIISFLLDNEKLMLIKTNKVFAEIITNQQDYQTLIKIKQHLKKDKNFFPFQLLMKKDTALLNVIMEEINIDLKSNSNRYFYICYISKYFYCRYFRASYYNEKLSQDIHIKYLTLNNLELTDRSFFYLLKIFEYNFFLEKVNLQNNDISLNSFQEDELIPKVKIRNNITELILVNNVIENLSILNEIISESKIKRLFISENPIMSNKTDLKSVESVEYLDFTQINRLNSNVIGDILNSYPNLKELNIGNNRFPKETMIQLSKFVDLNLQLKSLNISNNKLGSDGLVQLNSFFSNNTTLEELDISTNVISFFGALELYRALEANKNLKLRALNISDNFINSYEHGLGSKLISDIILNLKIVELDVSRNGIHAKCAFAISEVIKNNKYLRRINLSKNKIGEQGAIYLTECLKFNHTLEEIDLSSNLINSLITKTENLASAALKDDEFSFNQLIPNSMIPSIVRLSSSVKKLTLAYNKFGPDDCYTLSSTLINTEKKIEELHINNNLIGYLGLSNMEKYLDSPSFSYLITLNLNDNNIEKEGLELLMNYMKKYKASSKLRNLFLSRNTLNTPSMSYISEYLDLEEPSELCQLDLSGNTIGNKGMLILFNALYDNNHLERLNLSNNDITTLKPVKRLLYFNHTIDRLIMVNNLYEDDVIVSSLDDIPINVTLNRLVLKYD